MECYALDVEDSDSYVIRVYDNEKGFTSNSFEYKHEIAMSDVDSTGSIYDNGLQLEDKVVEQAIMDVLFGDKGIVIPF